MSDYQTVSEEAIKARAQQLYEEEGRPEGRSLEHWVRAERELRDEANSSGPKGGSPTSTRDVGGLS